MATDDDEDTPEVPTAKVRGNGESKAQGKSEGKAESKAKPATKSKAKEGGKATKAGVKDATGENDKRDPPSKRKQKEVGGDGSQKRSKNNGAACHPSDALAKCLNLMIDKLSGEQQAALKKNIKDIGKLRAGTMCSGTDLQRFEPNEQINLTIQSVKRELFQNMFSASPSCSVMFFRF